MGIETKRQLYQVLAALVMLHIVVIAASNYLVQIPFVLFGFNTTWGAYSYPLIFLATDLTVRIFGSKSARKIIFFAMFPALAVSYVFSVIFVDGHFVGWSALNIFELTVARIVIASFTAYVCGQLMDIMVFRRLMRLRFWWVAPAMSAVFGTLIDTLIFYAIAFVGSSSAFMAAHWFEFAMTDYAFKLLVSLGIFVPLYGMLLNWLKRHLLDLTGEHGRVTLATDKL